MKNPITCPENFWRGFLWGAIAMLFAVAAPVLATFAALQ